MLGSKMGEQRLIGLALLNIHRDIDVEVQTIIDRFANENKIYIALSILNYLLLIFCKSIERTKKIKNK
jgi:hypothetical protein